MDSFKKLKESNCGIIPSLFTKEVTIQEPIPVPKMLGVCRAILLETPLSLRPPFFLTQRDNVQFEAKENTATQAMGNIAFQAMGNTAFQAVGNTAFQAVGNTALRLWETQHSRREKKT